MKSSKIKHYDWARLKSNTETRYTFMTKVKTKFEALQDMTASLSASKRCTHFETVCKETADKVIPLKPKLKKRLPWEINNICQNRNILHQASRHKKNQSTPENVRYFNESQKYLIKTYEKEQTDYVQNKIIEIHNAMCNKKADLYWEIVNEVSGRNNSNRAKLKANSVNEFNYGTFISRNYLRKPTIPTSNDKSTVTLHNELAIKIWHFTIDELKKATKTIQNGKSVGLDEIPAEVCKLGEFQ